MLKKISIPLEVLYIMTTNESLEYFIEGRVVYITSS